MDFTSVAIDPAMAFVVIGLIAFGYFLKSTPDIPDWLIGWILLALSIIAALCKVGISVDGVVNGVIAAATAVYGNTLFKQTTINRITDRTDQATIASALAPIPILAPESVPIPAPTIVETSAPTTAIDSPKTETKVPEAVQDIVGTMPESTAQGS